MDASTPVRAVEELAGQRFEIVEDDIIASQADTYIDENRQEAL